MSRETSGGIREGAMHTPIHPCRLAWRDRKLRFMLVNTRTLVLKKWDGRELREEVRGVRRAVAAMGSEE